MIRVNHDYHVVELVKPLPGEVRDWLKEKYGDANGDRYFVKWPNIYFTDAKDHMMFVLRWS